MHKYGKFSLLVVVFSCSSLWSNTATASVETTFQTFVNDYVAPLRERASDVLGNVNYDVVSDWVKEHKEVVGGSAAVVAVVYVMYKTCPAFRDFIGVTSQDDVEKKRTTVYNRSVKRSS